jgi:hypothetical protein
MSAVSKPEPRALPAAAVNRRLTRGHSCVVCQQRKIRCDGQRACGNCVKSRAECRETASNAVAPRLRASAYRRELERLRRYEELALAHGLELDNDKVAGAVVVEPGVGGNEKSRSPESGVGTGKLILERGHSRYIEK